MISPESIKSRLTMQDHLVFAINVTPESNIPDASGATTPDFIVVRTPAAKEFEKVSRKRRCFFDDIIVLPNQLLKQQIDNSSDLVCKRRKAPHTALRVWKANQISSLPRSFLEPLLPDISSELRSLFCKRKLKTPKPVENVEAPENVDVLGSPTVHSSLNQIANALSTPVVEAPENVDVIGFPIVHRSPDQTDIAPSTPVTHSTSVRLHAVAEISNSDRVGPASSFESIRKEPSQCENQEFDISLLDEEVNSLEGDKQEMYGWSMRTRTVAGYLHRSFLNEKTRRGNAEVNLLQVLKGKTRKESARLFYEILVLKTGEFVDVKQDNAYGAILMLETPKLLGSCEVDAVYAS
ncbi:hypothetical protein F0562_004529 [Nyssa sinensis]|uniref:Rad21/Rec8-like protein C-terminal eukaryotic domain-containing protein n=1 Tax=Nyssa sinensis TaxID=561372 RepID=A0A5J5C241_9ASTE|nr:hypothetical protein F0562_004529 [Nyssa sinensis]